MNRSRPARLTYEDLERLRAAPAWRTGAKAVLRQVAAYRGEQPSIFVPDVPVSATEPVTGKLWYHGLGPVSYANMLRRFKRVLEPLVWDEVSRWRGQAMVEVIDAMYAYGDSFRPTLDRRDEEDRVRAAHLRLFSIFRGFYCSEPIDLVGAGPPGSPVYGLVNNGLHRLFVAQVLGTIETLPASVSLRTEGPVEKPNEAELCLDDEEQGMGDVAVLHVPWAPSHGAERASRPRLRRRPARRS